jgi:hypothetical protein
MAKATKPRRWRKQTLWVKKAGGYFCHPPFFFPFVIPSGSRKKSPDLVETSEGTPERFLPYDHFLQVNFPLTIPLE